MYIIRYKDTKEVIRTSKEPISLDGSVKGLDPNIEVLEVVNEAKPIYDTSAEKLTPSTVEENGKIINTFTVIPLTAEELATKAAFVQKIEGIKAERERILLSIIKVKDDPIGKILFDQAVLDGKLTAGGEIVSVH